MRRFLRENALLIATVASVVLGVLVGVLCRPLNPSSDIILLVGFPGEIFLRMLKMLMIPLIVASIITGVGSLKGTSSGRIGVISLLYYTSSSLVALLIALTFGMTIKPGSQYNDLTYDNQAERGDQTSGLDVFMDLLRNLIPDNIVGAAIQHSRTVVTGISSDNDGANVTELQDNTSVVDSLTGRRGHLLKETRIFHGENIMGLLVYCTVFGIILSRMGQQGLLVYCTVFGIILSRMGQQGSVIARLFDGINNITHQMIQLIMWYSPVGMMFLIASQVMASKDLSTAGHILAIYLAAEISALAVHFFIALPLMYFILTRGNALKVYAGALQALFTALATSASDDAMYGNQMEMDARIAGFVLPVGTTINMDGTAVYFIMGPIFISQYNGVSMSMPDILIISLTAMLSSVGSSALPGADFPILLLVLKAVGLPDRGVFFLLTIDWFMDRLRTMVNVAGDCLAVGIISRYARLPSRQMVETDVIPNGDQTLQALTAQDREINSSSQNNIQQI